MFRVACALLLALFFRSPSFADRPATLAPGALAPSWVTLPGVDGMEHSLADLKDAKVVIVVFTCNSCPYASAYEERINAFAKEYAPKGVATVAINVNNGESDRLPGMKQRAKEKGFVFPYLHDASQAIGRAYGATVTPHLFVLDTDRNIAYVGGFDDAKNPEKVTKHYVKDAVEALLAGRGPEVNKTRAAGCSIRYE